MQKRSFFLGLAASITALVLGVPQAGAVSVLTDSGSLGSFVATNVGIVAGITDIHFNLTTPAVQALQTVNGVSINIPASFTDFDVFFAPVGGSYAISSVVYTKTFGTPAPAAAAELTYSFAGGTGFANDDFLNLRGRVTGVLLNNLPGYDFSPYIFGGKNNFTFTATNYTGATSFATLITNVGATATGSGSFSEIAQPVPEPASMSMFGIGMLGLIALQRRFRKPQAV